MKQLFFLIVLSTIACQKQQIDCDNYQSHCRYIIPSFSDCSPNGNEIGWQWDRIKYDTIQDNLTWGCPEKIEQQFDKMQEETMNQSTTSEDLKHFMKLHPATCDCE